MNSLKTLAVVAGLAAVMTVDAAAATIRVQCEVRPGRARISVDAKNLAPGRYMTSVLSGANAAASPMVASTGDEVQTDYDSNPADVAAGAVAISSGFIQGGMVIGKVVDTNGNTVITDAVACRVRTR